MVRSIGPRVHRKGSLYPECTAKRHPSRHQAPEVTNISPKSCYSPYGFAVIETSLKPLTKRKRKTPRNRIPKEQKTFGGNKTRQDASYVNGTSKSNEISKFADSPTPLGGLIAESTSGITSTTNCDNAVTFVEVEQVQYSFVQANYEPSYWAMPTLSYTDESYETQKTPLKYGARDEYLTDWRDRDQFSLDLDEEDWRSPVY
ncbi:15629_t:CDS:2 [Acaulospora morrowiae]|uniref:15629_t:CDS:1 n=1 Tax=Acaulospora morrowiae TaxID=94023 RepID=A0A9N9EJH1_9GLOM|nr:15629_t:CDS:2 [Acaulospora morrowiae]